MLIHWPFAFENEEMPLIKKLPDGNPVPELIISEEYKETWKVLESLVKEGKIRSIGLSNFSY